MSGLWAFWSVVAITFLWGYGDHLLHGAWPPSLAMMTTTVAGMVVLGAIGVVTRFFKEGDLRRRSDRDTGVAVVGVVFALVSAAVVFVLGAAIEYFHRSPGGGGVTPALLAAAWHGLTVAAIALNALGTRSSEPSEPAAQTRVD